MEYPFTKMQGIGNDFVVFDTFTTPLNLSREQVRHIADRQFGIGCEFKVPEEAFMILELYPGYLQNASGEIEYHIAFKEM